MSQKLKVNKDKRGKLIEAFKIPGAGQVIYLTVRPGVVRGNHYHLRKKESYLVVEGRGQIALRSRKSNEIKKYQVSGEKPEVIEIPVGWSHNIKNSGKNELKLLIWVNEVFNPSDPDTYAEEV